MALNVQFGFQMSFPIQWSNVFIGALFIDNQVTIYGFTHNHKTFTKKASEILLLANGTLGFVCVGGSETKGELLAVAKRRKQ